MNGYSGVQGQEQVAVQSKLEMVIFAVSITISFMNVLSSWQTIQFAA